MVVGESVLDERSQVQGRVRDGPRVREGALGTPRRREVRPDRVARLDPEELVLVDHWNVVVVFAGPRPRTSREASTCDPTRPRSARSPST